jgi:hypothetical protein
MEKISIARALRTLKTLDSKIQKNINNGCFVNYKVGNEIVRKDCSPKKDLQSVNDMINYRDRLKSAIAGSNAITIIKLGDEEMTVVEAIERKNSIRFKEELLFMLESTLMGTRNSIDNHNDEVQRRLDRLIEASVGSDSNKKETDSISKPFLKRNKAELVDEIGIQGVIENLKAEIDDFKDDIDIELSTSNALTFIEV